MTESDYLPSDENSTEFDSEEQQLKQNILRFLEMVKQEKVSSLNGGMKELRFSISNQNLYDLVVNISFTISTFPVLRGFFTVKNEKRGNFTVNWDEARLLQVVHTNKLEEFTSTVQKDQEWLRNTIQSFLDSIPLNPDGEPRVIEEAKDLGPGWFRVQAAQSDSLVQNGINVWLMNSVYREINQAIRHHRDQNDDPKMLHTLEWNTELLERLAETGSL